MKLPVAFGARSLSASRCHWNGLFMLHPKQFEVNEAWIAFRLNNAPIRTERDGDFNCIALMDAASCFILGSELIPVTAAEPTRAQFRRLLKNAQRHKQHLPKTLFVPRGDVADRVTRGATERDIDVVRVPETVTPVKQLQRTVTGALITRNVQGSEATASVW